MKLRATEQSTYTLIEILANNDQPANGQNPINSEELATVNFPETNGKLLVVSGMPMYASVAVALRYKNMFTTIAVYDAREKLAYVVHTISPSYSLGTAITTTH